jgi:hypothetical protein
MKLITWERLAVAAAWVGVAALFPDLARLLAIAPHIDSELSVETADQVMGDLAAAGLWAICAWLALSSLAIGASRLPGIAGVLARAIAQRVAPGFVRRAMTVALGTGIALAPALAPGLAAAEGAPTPGITVAWPLSGDATAPPSWPTGPGDTPTAAPLPAAPAAPAAAAATATAPAAGDPSAEVVVQPGDTLWSIAAAGLRSTADPADPADAADAADIAAVWPRWYRANTDAIGSDPNLIRPGITLHAPTRGDTP